MRKFIFIFTITLLVITIVNACKKDSESMQTNPNNNTEQQYTDYEWEVYYKLQSFKQKQNSNMRGNDPMTLDSAEWYMETTFNVEEARTEEPYKITRRDSTYYTLMLNSAGMVEFSDMNNMYNNMLSDLDSIEYVIANPDILPIFATLDLLTNDGYEAEFMLILRFGEYYSGNYLPFLDIDDWKFGNMQGYCEITGGDSDGGQELKARLNHPLFQYGDPGSYIDPVQRSAFYYEYPDVNDENPDDNVNHMIFYEVRSIDEPCLEDDELTFYLDMAHDIFYTFDNQNLPNTTTLFGKRPIGKVYVDMTIWTPNGTLANGNNWWEHRYYINYATRINIPLPIQY